MRKQDVHEIYFSNLTITIKVDKNLKFVPIINKIHLYNFERCLKK